MRRCVLMLVAVCLVGVGPVAAQAGRPGGPCDRSCLERMAEQYLDALAAKDPKRVPIAPGAKYTENGQPLLLGDGVWNSISGRGSYNLFVTDVTAGQVVAFATMREAGMPVILALRLKVANGQIAEIETQVAHSENGAKGLEATGGPRAAFSRPTPPADRVSRAELVRVANMYFSGMQLNDGKGNYPFADDCHRFENGADTTNAKPKPGETRPDPKTATRYSGQWTCREQFESGLLHFVSRIRDRRYVAVDEERGLVVAFAFFDHDAGASRHFKTPDGRDITGGPVQPWTWQIAELFKVERGLLHEIEAILERVPYGMPSGWSSWEDGLSDKIQFAK